MWRLRSKRMSPKTPTEQGPSRDCYSADVRSRTMASVRSRDTSPELALRRGLHTEGVRGWRCHRKDLPGTPDLPSAPIA